MRHAPITAADLSVVATEPEVPAPRRPVSSYEVRLRPGVGDTIFLVGHDRKGEPMIETRLQRRHLTRAMVRRMQRWCREHDDPADLKLL